MNKKTKLKLNETLNKALEPPKRKNLNQLDELLNQYTAEDKSQIEIFEKSPNTQNIKSSLPRQTSQSGMSTQTRRSSQTSQSQEIAPTKDFQKVANSITKHAIPEGLFKGKDKHLYDVLYGLTRGAIQPKRKIRVSKTKLMKLSGIGSRITFDSCIERLKVVGLLHLEIFTGEHEGNEFEIFLPEEVKTLTSQSSHSSLTNPAQKLEGLVSLETSQTSQSINSTDTKVSEIPKTSLKTKTDDDEAFAPFIKKFQAAAAELTGKNLSVRDAANLEKIADLLILELEIAARRTDGVSSVPAFLTEILRRQFFTARQQQSSSSSKTSKTKSDVVGKSDSEIYEIKPLDEKGREAALEQLREFAADDFLQDFKKWYTPEDWSWLIKQLEK
jgi:hypothetical protein